MKDDFYPIVAMTTGNVQMAILECGCTITDKEAADLGRAFVIDSPFRCRAIRCRNVNADAALAWRIVRALLAQRGEPMPDDPDKIRERYEGLLAARAGEVDA